MIRLDFKAGWRAFIGSTPRLASPHLRQTAPRERSIFPLLRSAAIIAMVGAAILVVAIAGEAAHDQVVDAAHPHGSSLVQELVSFPTWLKLLSELGYACLIAAVVSFFIEATARREQTDMFEEAMSDIGASVLQGVYRIRHDPEYVKAVVNSCLAVRLVREDTDITYTVSEFTDAECAALGIESETFVKIEAEIVYSARNIGAHAENFEGAYNIPKRHGRIGEFARATSLSVGTTRYDAAALDGLLLGNGDPRHREGNRSYRFPLPVNAGDVTRVAVTSQFAKERSDNETFTFLLPTLGAKIRFLFNVADLEIGATPNMAANLPAKRDVVAGKHVKWEIDGPLIPHNNLTIWWRTPRDGGQDDHEPAVPAPVAVPVRDSPGTTATTPGPDASLQSTSRSARTRARWLPPWRRRV